MSTQSPSYYAIIPASVRYCKDLIPMARLFYGELTALTSKEGYCWANNKYFMSLYGVSEKSIRDWLADLNEYGFIKITYDDEKTHSGRKIWIIPENSNISYPPKKTTAPPVENCRHSIKSSIKSSKDKEITTTQAPKKAASPPVVVSSKTEALIRGIPKMTDKLFKSLVEKYSDLQLWKAYGVLQNSRDVENPIALLQKALKEDWDPNIPRKKQTLREWVEERFMNGKIYNGAECFIDNESVAFQRGMSNHKQLKFKENGFKDRFESILRHFGIK